MIDYTELQSTILRIQQMEEYMDRILNALSSCPDSIYELEQIREMISILTDYYDNGQWLKDYDLDSKGELPPDLKRGVLSQDALYNLLCDVKELQADNE